MTENPKPRGRPPKSDAITPAERARRHRLKKKAERLSGIVSSVTLRGGMDTRLLALQMKYDVERQLNVELRNALAARERPAPMQKSKPTQEVAEMRKTIKELERIVSAYSAEINRLRDELESSRKFSARS